MKYALRLLPCVAVLAIVLAFRSGDETASSWIRINQLGYTTQGIKAAVWCSKQTTPIDVFELVDASTRQVAYKGSAGRAFGAYGPFLQSHRLDFSSFVKPGRYFLRAGKTESPEFAIADDVYKGSADFCLRYMRQQRSGYNPFLKDSCHTRDGYTLYGPMKDSTYIDATGGWHDASDYLQYTTTSANATYHLLAAYRDFPGVFSDTKTWNGLDGKNGVADVLDEAKWGLDWLNKMNPKEGWMFNQLGDDRDHKMMRIPKEDTNYYGRGIERPLYFVTGKPQVRGKFMNATTGVASTAGKFASSFALAAELYAKKDPAYAKMLLAKADAALKAGIEKPGVAQTASVLSPYIYAEDNWQDDMELGAAAMASAGKVLGVKQNFNSGQLTGMAYNYAQQEPLTPWLGTDTAKHYQWYPFVNVGHYELARQLKGKQRDTVIAYYKTGIEKVWEKATTNAFYRAIPFIWCSNNLTVSFATQCLWYRELTGDTRYSALEQANIDWLFGCNPWGTSMVYGLPSWGDTPVDPHSAFTHLKQYPIDGGLVDGPVYTAIYNGLIGIRLTREDSYAPFQSDLAVYHDDYGDYSTNEPTMDGTASLIYLLAAKEADAKKKQALKPAATTPLNTNMVRSHGAVIRGDSTRREIALVFTGDEFGDGLSTIINTMNKQAVKGSFFLTGRFYNTLSFREPIRQLYREGHYMGPHSNDHLLYCDWTKRDSLLVTRSTYIHDLNKNLDAMRAAGIPDASYRYFIPPYEWWNDAVAKWSNESGIRLFCFTPGTTSNADYTYPEMGNSYKSSETILNNIKRINETRPGKLNGMVLLIHAGTDPRRTDKLYNKLDELISYLKKDGYSFKTIDKLIGE